LTLQSIHWLAQSKEVKGHPGFHVNIFWDWVLVWGAFCLLVMPHNLTLYSLGIIINGIRVRIHNELGHLLNVSDSCSNHQPTKEPIIFFPKKNPDELTQSTLNMPF
jgi:hypothetical protein